MEALDTRPLERDGGMMGEEEEEEEREEQEEEGMEALSPVGSNSEEESDEDSEPEPPLVIRRKVSFADAFGLNLVSVKEFDNVEAADSEVSRSDEREVTLSLEEFHMSCLFAVPSSPEELDERLRAQMVELESIELLPGTTTLRCIVRVVNLCFSKSVFARFSLDRWGSHFDLLAEYVPGSSDRKTDRFSFSYTLVPPFQKDGTRVEFCLRYETSVGTFWANNKQMNYVLFLHQKGHVKEPQVQEESSSYKGKRSCLKANRNGGADERNWESITAATYGGGLEDAHKAEKADRKAVKGALHNEDHRSLVESVRSRHKATRLARVQDYLSQRRHQVPAYPHDSADGQKASQPLPAPWGASASYLGKCQKTQASESPQVLTYHQIPLLTLDWNNETPQRWGAADVGDIWTGKAKVTLSSASEGNAPSANDVWGTFLNGADDRADKEAPVCDVWQAFLNGPSCGAHSAVPESEWLQTATSVSPSNDKDLRARYAASSQELPGFRGGAGAPAALRAHTFAACQPLSHSRDTPSANLALNGEDHQPAEACVSSPRDDTAATRAASQRSQTNSVTDTPQEFSLQGAPPVSEDAVDCSARCHAEGGGIIGGGGGGDGPVAWRTADSVTSSGESETTDMTAMPESQNASAVDRISRGAGLQGGLSSGGEGEVTGTAHNAVDDTLAFRETIRRGTKDGARHAVATEEGIAANSTENKADAGEEIAGKTGEREISPRYADETRREKSGLNPNSENPLQESEEDENEMRSAQLDTGGFEQYQTSGGNSEQNKTMATELGEDFPSNNQRTKVIEKTEEETSFGAAREEMMSFVIENVERMRVLNEIDPLQEDSSVISEVNDADEEPGIQKKERSASIQTEEVVELRSETDDLEESPNCDKKGEEQQEMNCESCEMRNVLQEAQDYYPTDTPKPLEVVEARCSHSQEETKGQREDARSEGRPGEVTNKRDARRDTSTEHRPERTEEDPSQGDERVRIGKLKIDATRELMGNVKGPQARRENATAQLKEGGLSAQVESSPRVEFKTPSDGTKGPISAENTASLQEMGSGLEEMLVKRFAGDLISGIWEEVFGQASNRDTNTVEGMDYGWTDTTQNCPLLLGKDADDTCDSGVFSLIEFPQESGGGEQTEGNQSSPGGRIEAVTEAQTHIFSESQTAFDSSARPSAQLSTESSRAGTSSLDQENAPQIQQRSASRPEPDTADRSLHPSHKHQRVKDSDRFSWWSVLYVIIHLTRLLVCILLVAGFFVFVFLYDFPAFFGLYVFSLCWWFYKWRRHRVATQKTGWWGKGSD